MIKICGVLSINDVRKAVISNTKFIGLNFYKKSKRYIGNNYLKIINVIPKSIFKVALFVNNSYKEIFKLKKYFDFFQFHGDESYLFCELFKKKYFKTIKIFNKNNFNYTYNSKYFYFFLIDKKSIFYGGNNEIYKHFKIFKNIFFISGGINDKNYKKILKLTSCLNLDICSSIEYNSIKNYKKILKIY